MDLSKLTELLNTETYPMTYVHKFIGVKTPAFLAAVAQLETAFPLALRTGERESAAPATDGGSGGGRYLALTYELKAKSAAEIIELWKATVNLPDLKIIL